MSSRGNDRPDVSTLVLLKALADETRLRIVSLLLQADDLCSCEIEAVLGLGQSNTSRHLGRLRRAGIIVARQVGHWVHFSLAGVAPGGTAGSETAKAARPATELIVKIVLAARRDTPVLQSDLERLEDYRTSGHSCESIREWQELCARG